MRIVRALGGALVLCALLAGQAGAANTKRWTDRTLHLGLAYPGDWRVVPERGAALKLVALDAAGEFEVFALPSPLSSGALVAQADAALAKLHCATAIRHQSGTVGHLGVGGRISTGTCTGADRGWQLTITTFAYRSRALLLRSWLFHAQQRDGAALAAIVSSLVPAGP